MEEAFTNTIEAVEAYVLSLKDRGLPVPEEGADSTRLISMISVEI